MTETERIEDAKVLAYLQQYREIHGYAPSRREIMEALGKRSPSEAQRAIERMVMRGLIEIDPKVPRAIRVVRMVADTEAM